MGTVINEYSERNAKLVKGGVGLYAQERSDLFHQCIGSGKHKQVLDLGSNHGAFTNFFVQDYEVTAVDFDQKNLDVLTQKMDAKTIVFDLNEDISTLGKGKWDAIIMSEVLEHLFFPEKKVAQIATLLKPDGVFVGTVPNGFSLLNRVRYLCNQPEKTSMAEPTHITHFSVKRLRKALEAQFGYVRMYPIGSKKHAMLANLSPNLFAFCLAFECRNPK